MKKTLLLLISVIFLMACESNKSAKTNYINPEKYFSLKYDSFDYQGQSITDVNIVAKDLGDSISNFMKKHKRRFDYILINRIDNLTLDTLYPDTTKIKTFYLKSLVKEEFNSNFNKLLLNDISKKEEYSIDEMMYIASKFFLIEKSPMNDAIGTRICIGINGTEDINSEKDFTLLEACSFDFIIERSFAENPEESFMMNLDKYVNNEREKLSAVSDYGILETKLRPIIYKKMENDTDLKKALLTHYELNKKNLPYIIIRK